jgi:hypothetical protein
MVNFLAAGFNALVGWGKNYTENKQKLKQIKQQSTMKIAELNAEAAMLTAQSGVELAKKGQQIQADYDKRAQQSMRTSWKDEYLLVLGLMPVIMCFIPGFQEIAKQGFQIINELPYWYRILIWGMYASVFGLRWLIEPMVRRFNVEKEKKTTLIEQPKTLDNCD